jgi:hypothetical protein
MAYRAVPTRADALAPFIYIWPSRELASRSWSWSTSWHEAFQDAAGRIALAVAIYDLDGRRFTRRLVSLQLSIGTVRFRVKRRGGSIFVTVAEFAATAPQRPDRPNGTRRQPGAADGIVLGLHGSEKGHYLVVFHGRMPPVPAGPSLGKGKARLMTTSPGRHGPDTTADPAPAGPPFLGARRGCDLEGDREPVSAGPARRTGSQAQQAQIIRSGTVTLGRAPSQLKDRPTASSDVGMDLHWTLFWCTSGGPTKGSPIFSSQVRRQVSADRLLETDRLLFDPAGIRCLH